MLGGLAGKLSVFGRKIDRRGDSAEPVKLGETLISRFRSEAVWLLGIEPGLQGTRVWLRLYPERCGAVQSAEVGLQRPPSEALNRFRSSILSCKVCCSILSFDTQSRDWI